MPKFYSCYCISHGLLFSQIRLFKFINNHLDHVESARKLLQIVSGTDLRLPLSFVNWLHEQRICSTIKGFYNSTFQLYKLGNLLDENWLEEDVLNSLFELRYLGLHASTGTLGTSPSVLYLPTTFFINARELYHSFPRIYSKELRDFRKRIRETRIHLVAFCICENNHYASYVWNYRSSELEHGDSLHRPPSHDVLSVFQWVLSGLEDLTAVTSIKKGQISLQGVHGQGTGSCGIVSLNFIKHLVDPDIPLWMSSHAKEFRDHALRDLPVYHRCAIESLQNEHIWFENCITQSPWTMDVDHIGYLDFNMFSPKVCHIKDYLLHYTHKHFLGQSSYIHIFADHGNASTYFCKPSKESTSVPCHGARA
jgi:hypothetical protein